MSVSMTHSAVLLLSIMPMMSAAATTPILKVVPSVDLERYAGTWHEIARLPNRFQRDCDHNTSATYARRPDGRITVTNECVRSDGKMKRITGTARIASKEGPNTKLRVTFFWPFYGNYWIIDLDPEYRWAVVGEPSRRYFWILAREPRLATDTVEGIIKRAEAQGYDLATLRRDPGA
jgi:apolipoprotein D and lipocalin family protein